MRECLIHVLAVVIVFLAMVALIQLGSVLYPSAGGLADHPDCPCLKEAPS